MVPQGKNNGCSTRHSSCIALYKYDISREQMQFKDVCRVYRANTKVLPSFVLVRHFWVAESATDNGSEVGPILRRFGGDCRARSRCSQSRRVNFIRQQRNHNLETYLRQNQGNLEGHFLWIESNLSGAFLMRMMIPKQTKKKSENCRAFLDVDDGTTPRLLCSKQSKQSIRGSKQASKP